MIRPYRESDLPRLLDLHRSFHAPNGEVFPTPDAGADFLTIVDEDENTGELRGAVVMRMTFELFGIGNKGYGGPLDRFQTISSLISAAAAEAARVGVEEVHCAVPPSIRRYGDRLVEMGHVRDERQWYTVDCLEQQRLVVAALAGRAQ